MPVFASGGKWPVLEDKEIEKFRPGVKKRANAVVMNVVKLTGIRWVLLWIGARFFLNKMMSKAAMGSIKKSLTDHQLLKAAPEELS